MTNILITDDYSLSAKSFLSSIPEVFLCHSLEHQPSDQEIKDCHALLIRSKTKVSAQLVSKAPNLRFIGTATSGLDHIDLEACQQKGIVVFNPADANARSAAEHALSLLLCLSKNLIQGNLAIRNGQWRSPLSRGLELYGQRLSLIGVGRVGSHMAKISQGLGMEVFGYDPYKEDAYFKNLNIQRVGLSEAISCADIISLHTPLTDETKNILNRKNMQQCNENCLIINTSRGDCLNQTDLIDYLNSGKIAGAALDVFQKEPLKENSPLLKANNLLMSPHIGAFTQSAFENASLETVKWLLQQLSLN